MDSSLESAIPKHLQIERTVPARRKEGHMPPYPSFSARFDTATTQVVMTYLGVQYAAAEMPESVRLALRKLDETCHGDSRPGHVDRAKYLDERGYTTVATIAYWDDTSAYEQWRDGSGAFWLRPETIESEVGWFTETLSPSVTRFETLFSNDRPEGVSNLAEGLSGEVLEHGYWGGVRDRLPVAQEDVLSPSGAPRLTATGAHAVVVPHENLCLIRSGQEWTETEGTERAVYLEDVEPVLREGMDYLTLEGREIGCFANRYMRVVDSDFNETDKSFGMSWWRSLADLDQWAEHHPTHKAIFGSAMKYLSTMGPAAKLRLYHEVTVARADEQHFEYLNCHPSTGMLRAVEK